MKIYTVSRNDRTNPSSPPPKKNPRFGKQTVGTYRKNFYIFFSKFKFCKTVYLKYVKNNRQKYNVQANIYRLKNVISLSPERFKKKLSDCYSKPLDSSPGHLENSPFSRPLYLNIYIYIVKLIPVLRFVCTGIGLSRPAKLAVLRARVPDGQSGFRRSLVLEHRRDSTAVNTSL